MCELIQLSNTIWLSADDEIPDTVVQDCNGIDYIVCEHCNGKLYWEKYLLTDLIEDDAKIFEDLAVVHFVKSNNSLAPVLIKTEEKPTKKPSAPRQPTAYNMFLKEVLKELSKTHGHLNNKDRMKMASVMWNDLKAI